MIKSTHNNKELIFDEENHIYTVDNQKYVSVTQNISRFFEPFNMERISLRYALKNNLNQNDVIQMWKDRGKEAADFGTLVHKFIECKLLKIKTPKPKTEKEKVYFNHIVKWIKCFLKYYRVVDVEKIVFSPEFRLAGMIDAIFQNKKTGKYLFLDWKTSKKIEFENKWHDCINGLGEFQASSFNKFSFQLNSYLYVLRKELYYRFRQKPELKVIHITENGLRGINIPILKKRIIDILFLNVSEMI